MFVDQRNDVHRAVPSVPTSLEVPDPLDADRMDDQPVIVSRRRLARLALVSSEVTARFIRDGLEQDPMAWMFAPRALFDGRAAIEAALELQCCNRAIVLHGLGLGLDAEADVIDELCAPEEEVASDPRRAGAAD